MNELSNIDLLIIDDFITVGIDSDAASDLFAILANREHRLPTMIASQTTPAPTRPTGNETEAARALRRSGRFHLVRTALPSAWTGATIERYSPLCIVAALHREP